MRFDNLKAQRAWNRRVEDEVRPHSSWRYCLAAATLSAVWVIDLALAGCPPGEERASGFVARLGQWLPYCPTMIAAGVAVAFLFRDHIRTATWKEAAVTALLIGLVASIIAGMPSVGFVVAGPYAFVEFWMVTFPMSWFSFWIMRKADASLTIREADHA